MKVVQLHRSLHLCTFCHSSILDFSPSTFSLSQVIGAVADGMRGGANGDENKTLFRVHLLYIKHSSKNSRICMYILCCLHINYKFVDFYYFPVVAFFLYLFLFLINGRMWSSDDVSVAGEKNHTYNCSPLIYEVEFAVVVSSDRESNAAVVLEQWTLSLYRAIIIWTDSNW